MPTADRPQGIRTWQDAEIFAVSILRAWGYRDAALTTGGADGGIDIRGTHVVGQVKHRSAPTGRPDIQRLYGARGVGTQDLVFFSRSGYSPAAIDYAQVHDVALFSYDDSGRVTSHTRTAERMMPADDEVAIRLAPSHATNGATPPDASGIIFWTLLIAFGLGCFFFEWLADTM